VRARGSRAKTCFREMCVGVAVAIMRKRMARKEFICTTVMQLDVPFSNRIV